MILDPKTYHEIWHETPDGQSLCALTNGDSGWLMYLRKAGDAGFSSRNPDYIGDPHTTIEYHLSNGQHDEYPKCWALPINTIERAFQFFRENNRPPTFITWHNDSADGTHIGAP